MEWLSDPQSWIALATLTGLEIVLGVDNIIFISILVSRLPEHRRNSARLIGLSLAMGTRILLLLSLAWIMTLTGALFTVLERDISGRDLILISGGLFLLWKSVHEIHESLEGGEETQHVAKTSSFASVLAQIAIIDIVFSLDSVITAVGMVNNIPIMVTAVVLSVLLMMVAAKPLGDFVDRHPTLKLLALSFLIMVGTTLVAEGLGFIVPKGYIYFAMAFSVAVEMLNLRIRSRGQKNAEPVKLHKGADKL